MDKIKTFLLNIEPSAPKWQRVLLSLHQLNKNPYDFSRDT